MDTNILEVNDVTKSFGELIAVNHLSFTIEQGCVFGIAGPNGAGKTTLFNVISGVYGSQGSILFDSKDISRLKPYNICKLGLARTFQFPVIFSTLSVYKNIEIGAYYGGNYRKDINQKVCETIEYLGLAHKSSQKVKDLPLYEKKMVMLGAALATNPKLIMLDEPLGGLSPKEINMSMEIFRKINKDQGVTLIIIEHLMKYLIEISDTMLILNEGQKIYRGEPAEVIHDDYVIKVYLGEDYKDA